MLETLSRDHGTRTRCGVCGFTEMRTDLVLDRDLLLLRECPRCHHRDTRREALPVGPRPVRAPAHEHVA